MRRPAKAILYSLLVFPGAGHFFLRQWWRGLMFLVPSLWALWVVVTFTVDRAMQVADKILRGEVAADPQAILAALDSEKLVSGNLVVNLSAWLLLACWAVAAIDIGIRNREAARA